MDIDPEKFSSAWFQAWNTHDVEAALAHFHEDVTFTSPYAAEILPDTGGVIHGKQALRRYWTKALATAPDLRFEPVGLYVGVHTIVINYRNQKGGLVNEVLVFDGDRVIEGHGTYPRSR